MFTPAEITNKVFASRLDYNKTRQPNLKTVFSVPKLASVHFEFPVAETIDIQKLYHKSANIESISPVLQPLVTEFSACSGCLLLVQRPCTVFSSQSTLKLFIMRECRPLQQLLMLHCLPPQKSLPCLGPHMTLSLTLHWSLFSG